MTYLLDTNVVSEPLRKRPSPQVLAWLRTVRHETTYLSALVLGELRHGVELKRRNDPRQAEVLEGWVAQLQERFADRVVPVDAQVADVWGRLHAADPLPPVDGLMAATALVHDWTFVTRNTKHAERTGARLLNPFEDPHLDR